MISKFFTLPINIHVGEIKIERGFKFELFNGNYFDIIDQYNDLYSDLIDIYGKQDIDKIIEICLSVLNNRIAGSFYISSKTKQGDRFERGYFTNVNIKDYTKPYKCEGELIQLFQFILNTTPNKFKVVDFDDEELATTKTISEARRVFKSQYPYMDDNLIDNFIYKT